MPFNNETVRRWRRRWPRLAPVALVAVSLALLSGCESWKSAFKIQNIDPEQSIAQSANFRNVYIRSRATGKDDKIICPEPSPDAIAVAATSFAASIGIAGKGGGSVGSSTAEAALSLFARSQAIQAVRDTATGACLAYQNGLLPRFGYQMMMAAYPTLLLNAMAIEGVTGGPLHQPGGVVAPLPSITTNVSQSSGAGDGQGSQETGASIAGAQGVVSDGQQSPDRTPINNAAAIEAVGNMASKGISLYGTFVTACLMRLADKDDNQLKSGDSLDQRCKVAIAGKFEPPPNAAALNKAIKVNIKAITANAKATEEALEKAKEDLAKVAGDIPKLTDYQAHLIGKAYIENVQELLKKSK